MTESELCGDNSAWRRGSWPADWGMDPGMIGDLESDRRKPSDRVVATLERFLRVEQWDLWLRPMDHPR